SGDLVSERVGDGVGEGASCYECIERCAYLDVAVLKVVGRRYCCSAGCEREAHGRGRCCDGVDSHGTGRNDSLPVCHGHGHRCARRPCLVGRGERHGSRTGGSGVRGRQCESSCCRAESEWYSWLLGGDLCCDGYRRRSCNEVSVRCGYRQRSWGSDRVEGEGWTNVGAGRAAVYEASREYARW